MIRGNCLIPGRTPLARLKLRYTMPDRESIDGVIVEEDDTWIGN
jgi:hypothetical protein